MQSGKFVLNAMLGLMPDILIAWGYAKYVDGGWQEFWIALVALQVLYFALSLKRAAWAWLLFWVYNRRSMARVLEKFFRDNKFPRPELWVGTLDDYVEQIVNDETIDNATKLKATFEQGTLNGFKVAQDVTLVLMMGLASKRAIERYARYAPERP
jgi:hypothetical protein